MSERDACLKKLNRLGKDYAEKKANYNALERETKIKLSFLYQEKRGEGKTSSDSEHMARADSRYMEMSNKLKTADEEYHVAWAKLEAEKISWEIFRTEQANKRSEQFQADRGV